MVKRNIPKINVIDANGKSTGRIASAAARLLQGKHKPVYAPNRDCGDIVVIRNISGARFTGDKFNQKAYFHYSGYPGGVRKFLLRDKWAKNPAEVMRRVVREMLPDNTLRKIWIKRLRVEVTKQ